MLETSATIRTRKGAEIIIDAADAPLLAGLSFSLNAKGYAGTNIKKPEGGFRWIFIHRILLDVPEGLQVDHINGDKLDNRRANLRVVTNAQNCRARLYRTNRTGLVGVSPRRNRFYAVISVDGQRRSLGGFATAQEAHARYAEEARRLFGEFIPLNLRASGIADA